MRIWLIGIVISLTISSCEVDELPACSTTGVEGEICKEYQYVNGRYNGLNEYHYSEDGKQLLVKTTKNKNGSEEGSAYYSYNSDGKVSSIELRASSGSVVQTQLFEYDSNGNLVMDKSVGEFNATKNYFYDQDLLKVVEYKEDGETILVDSLEYYTGTKDLYRTLSYSKGVLQSITYQVWFGNNVLTKDVYNAWGTKLSREVYSYSESGDLLEEIFYTASGSLKTKNLYSYDENKLIEARKLDEEEEEFERLVYQRF